jgi:hypothetical protein
MPPRFHCGPRWTGLDWHPRTHSRLGEPTHDQGSCLHGRRRHRHLSKSTGRHRHARKGHQRRQSLEDGLEHGILAVDAGSQLRHLVEDRRTTGRRRLRGCDAGCDTRHLGPLVHRRPFKLGLGRRKRAIATQMLLVTTTPASWNLLTAEREDADAGGVGVHTPTVRIRPPDPTRRQRPTIPPHPDAPRRLTLRRK